jgi:predicted PurR-regulated permease PerM
LDVRSFLLPAARLSLNFLLVAAAVYVLAWLAVRLWLVVLPVMVSLLVAALLVPPAGLLKRRRVPSVAATLLTMLGGLLLVAGALSLVVPAFIDQFDELEASAREGLDEAIAWLTQTFGIERAAINRAIDQAISSAQENSATITRGVLSGAAIAAESIAALLLVAVLVFFFVHDGQKMWAWLVGLFPRRHREDVNAIGEKIWAAISGYVRGVAFIALVDALLIGAALLIIGVPLVVPLMVLTFLGAFLPLVGAVLAGAVAALVALVTQGVVAAILVAVAITAIQQVEGDLLYPLVVGRAISLHPVAILLVLTAGSVLAGIVGALLAVPVAAAVWSAVDHLRRRGDQSPSATALLEPDAGRGAVTAAAGSER